MIALPLLCCMLAFDASAHCRVSWDNPGKRDYDTTRLTLTIGGYSLSPVIINGKEYQTVRLDNGGMFAPKGCPNLPNVNKAVIIPDEGRMQVKVLDSNYADIPVTGITPSRGRILRTQDPASVPYIFNETYEHDTWYPSSIVMLEEPFIQRDFRGCLVRVFPFQYNPIKKILRGYSKIALQICGTGAGGANLLKRTHALAGVDAEFGQFYQQRFLNYASTRYPVLSEDGSMLIIAPSDFMSTLAPFIEWKKKKGVTVEAVAVETAGTTAAAVQSFIATAYNKPGSTLKYVLLIGDVDRVPTPALTEVDPPGGGGADIKYGEIKGNDCYSEVLIGRFSGITPGQIKTQIDRSLYYETKLTSNDTWLSNVLLTASNDTSKNVWGETDADFINHEYDTLLSAGYTQVFRHNEDGVGGAGCVTGTAASVTGVINSGISFWNYSDHGNKTSFPAVNFSNDQAFLLSNVKKYFYSYAVACYSGEFSTIGGDCLAEALMKAEINGQPLGAIGCYMASISQAWDPPYAAVREILEISLERYPANKKYTLGGVMINGGMKAYEVCPNQDGRDVVESFVLFGDPNLQIYTNTPIAMTITAPEKIGVGPQVVKVIGSADGAQVCLYSAKQSLQAVGTIAGGSASLSINPSMADTLSITATLFNHETFQGTVIVDPSMAARERLALASRWEVRCCNGRVYYRVAEAAGDPEVDLTVFSLRGSRVACLFHAPQRPGNYSVALGNGRQRLAGGTYLVEMKIKDVVRSIMIAVK